MRRREGPKSRARLAASCHLELAGSVHSGPGPRPGVVGGLGREEGPVALLGSSCSQAQCGKHSVSFSVGTGPHPRSRP